LPRGDRPSSTPAALRVMQRTPALHLLPARLIGYGVRPEHTASPAGPADR
jgi:hypothetical protein